MTKNDSFFEKPWTEFRNVFLISVISLVEGLLLLLAVSYISSFVPVTTELTKDFLPENLRFLLPEREMLFYRGFVIFVIALQAILLVAWRKRLSDPDFPKSVRQFLTIKLSLLLLGGFAAYKLILNPNIAYGHNLLIFALVASVLIKGGYLIQKPLAHFSLRFEILSAKNVFFYRALDWAMPLLIFLLIYVPDREGMTAAVFAYDSFFHFDSFIMASVWSFLKGAVLNIDVIGRYAVGMPVMTGLLLKWVGGISYQNVLYTIIFGVITYYILAYLFLRVWLKDVFLAIIGVLLAIRLGMFSDAATNPIIWRFPSSCVFRYFFDIIFLFCIYFHLQYKTMRFLVAAGVCAGIAIFYMNDTGVYQWVTLMAYLAILAVFPHMRESIAKGKKVFIWLAGYALLPVVVGLSLLWLTVGKYLWTPTYWFNTSEFTRIFLGGFGSMPIYDNLVSQQQYLAFFVGLIIPLFYVFTIVSIGSLCYLRKIKTDHLLAVVIAIYGLCLYHYYICRSASTSYFAVCVPMIFLLCFWVRAFLGRFDEALRQRILGAGVALVFFGFFTTRSVIEYPNTFNFTKRNFDSEKALLKKELAIDEDVRLIQKYTAPQDKVCLISSFDVAILMAADRKPFFYYFPLIQSRYFTHLNFGGTYLFTHRHLKKTFAQLAEEKPEYIFIEKRLYFRQVHPIYYRHYASLITFIVYLDKFYTIKDQGQFLLALRLKENPPGLK